MTSRPLNGHQEPGDAIVAALGREKVASYRRVR